MKRTQSGFHEHDEAESFSYALTGLCSAYKKKKTRAAIAEFLRWGMVWPPVLHDVSAAGGCKHSGRAFTIITERLMTGQASTRRHTLPLTCRQGITSCPFTNFRCWQLLLLRLHIHTHIYIYIKSFVAVNMFSIIGSLMRDRQQFRTLH